MTGLLHFYQAESIWNHPAVAAIREQLSEWPFPLSPYFVDCNSFTLEVARACGFETGITATNPGFYGPQGRQLRAPVRRKDYLDLLQGFEFEGRRIRNLEMETAAIYGLAQLLGHRALSLSVVLANRADGSFSTNAHEDVNQLIIKALDLITKL